MAIVFKMRDYECNRRSSQCREKETGCVILDRKDLWPPRALSTTVATAPRCPRCNQPYTYESMCYAYGYRFPCETPKV